MAVSTQVQQCPVLTPEFLNIQKRHKTFASTGCSAQFCQAGRSIHTDEPRVGENRALKVVEQEAKDFLEEMRQDGFFDSDDSFCERLRAVLKEIRTNASNGIVRQSKKQSKVGGNWQQTSAELEFGLRRAWRNSRKCIMRSHCEELKLCDLRSVTSSAAMATELIKGATEAFNNGSIQPTVFVFPPRNADSRGPMIWNNQLLAFAGYEMDDQSILGDPMSRELTKAVIELGWTPPEPKSKWDLLPLVTMAGNDVPVIAELPPELRKLVEIRHPHYGKEFESLDLKWVTFPALTRLGFDIGGVQYTATPFIGWFMDAEIGVRNLADSSRYNVLPDIVEALGLANSKIGEIAESFEDLPEYERLAMLSRAQGELNYAVYSSFSQAKISMTDSLTASMKWSRYDDEFKEKNGFRLPADPYWLAPPQGSIIPLWHRGGAPNYQPKPMICRHVQDPIKAWSREKPDWFISAKEVNLVANLRKTRPKMHAWRSSSFDASFVRSQRRLIYGFQKPDIDNPLEVIVRETEVPPDATSRCIEVYFCSAGTIAEKIAMKLHDRTVALVEDIEGVEVTSQVQPLNNLQLLDITQDKVLLLVVSSTGQGEVPPNGNDIIALCQELIAQKTDNLRFSFAIYGNGDSRYSRTYNGAAKLVQQHLRRVGGRPIAGGLFQGDTAVQSTAFQALMPWWAKLQPAIQDLGEDPYRLTRTHSEEKEHPPSIHSLDSSRDERISEFATHNQYLETQFASASLLFGGQQVRPDYQGSYLLTLDIGSRSYEDLGCIQVLPVNAPAKVRKVLRLLGVSASALVDDLDPNPERCPNYSRFFAEFVDLEAPFAHTQWIEDLGVSDKIETLDTETLSTQPVLEVLQIIQKSGLLDILTVHSSQPKDTVSNLRLDICLSMPLLQARNYSIASSRLYISQSLETMRPTTFNNDSNTNLQTLISPTQLQILVKPQPNGRFSSTFLTDCSIPAVLKYRLTDSACGPALRSPSSMPQIIIATGAGFAPVRCLLQRRIVAARSQPLSPFPSLSPSTPIHQSTRHHHEGPISLFLGLKPADIPLVTDLLIEAAEAGVLDSMNIVPSNEGKVRVYEKLEEEGAREAVRRKLVDEGGRVFVCAGPDAARGTKEAIGRIIGFDVKMGLGARWVEEIF